MVQCAVTNCKKRSERDRDVRYFAIPAVRDKGPIYSRQRALRRRALWISRLNKEGLTVDTAKNHMRICSRHFVSGAPSVAADENHPDWAPSINLGYELEPALTGNNEANIKTEPYSDTDKASATVNHIQSINPDISSCIISIKEENLSDQINLMWGEQEFKVDTSVIDLVHVSISESPEKTGSIFIDKGAELNELQRVHTALLNEHIALKSEHVALQEQHKELKSQHTELQKEHSELKKYYAKLRDKLTDAEVDKLELNTELATLKEDCKRFSTDNAVLKNDFMCQVEKLELYEKHINELKSQLDELQEKKTGLEKQLDKALYCGLSYEQLKRDDLLVECYTGLPSCAAIETILSLVKPHVTETSNVLAPWECLLLTLMRLKLSLTLQDLGDRFTASTTTICRLFERWLYYLYKSLNVFVEWPDKESLQKSMPVSIKKVFGDCPLIILDCLEIAPGRPGSQGNKISFDSKCQKSVKFLTAFTPEGTIALVSKAWEGKCSDKVVIARSGLLEKLKTGDLILAKDGFLVDEDKELYCAKVVVPETVPDHIKLVPQNISDKYKPALIREYIKNVTNTVRNKYTFMQSSLSLEVLSIKQGHDVCQIEEIMHVCCALTNMSYKMK